MGFLNTPHQKGDKMERTSVSLYKGTAQTDEEYCYFCGYEFEYHDEFWTVRSHPSTLFCSWNCVGIQLIEWGEFDLRKHTFVEGG